jgi:hypothetical protein
MIDLCVDPFLLVRAVCAGFCFPDRAVPLRRRIIPVSNLKYGGVGVLAGVIYASEFVALQKFCHNWALSGP